ncbi:type II secretion system F family protein [Actinomadura flavalba]|uniref:type II secretion system F family protein n=1 Tax=Actinomadura flavalba TaxID=1120938 RepID=UPI0009DBE403|nr:type II secretion system F family protein [Actinomadura flavalba]
MSLVATSCFGVCAALLWWVPSPAELRVAAGRPSRVRAAARGRDVRVRRGVAVLAGLSSAFVLGGLTGAIVGVAAAAALMTALARLGGQDDRRRRSRVVADLPIAVDLLAACLRAGTPWHDALSAVATAVGGPLADDLEMVVTQLRLGADPADAWRTLADRPESATLARTALRVTTSGATLAPALARLAADRRRQARADAMTRARTAGIHALAPLGLCFLPAFVLLGIVPAIAGIASTLLIPW